MGVDGDRELSLESRCPEIRGGCVKDSEKRVWGKGIWALTFLNPSPAGVLPVSYGICEQCGPGCGIDGRNTPVLGAVL